MKHAALVALAIVVLAGPLAAQDKAELRDFFETKIRPVLAENCFSCHGPKKQQAGLRLDGRDFLVKGDDGPVVVPGHPEQSKLLKAVRHEGDVKMPPKGKLPDAVVKDLATWIKHGAFWPEEKAAHVKDAVGSDGKKHWAFQPVRKPSLPAVRHNDWPATPIDAFILAKLEAQ